MKKFLIWFGAIAVVLVLLFVLSMGYAAFNKPKLDKFSENYAKTIVNGFTDMSEEQFNRYWGENPPGSPEQRKSMIKTFRNVGILKQIDKVERLKYMYKVTFEGLYYFYVYDVYATYSNHPVRFRLWFRVHKNTFDVLNMKIYWGVAIDQDKDLV